MAKYPHERIVRWRRNVALPARSRSTRRSSWPTSRHLCSSPVAPGYPQSSQRYEGAARSHCLLTSPTTSQRRVYVAGDHGDVCRSDRRVGRYGKRARQPAKAPYTRLLLSAITRSDRRFDQTPFEDELNHIDVIRRQSALPQPETLQVGENHFIRPMRARSSTRSPESPSTTRVDMSALGTADTNGPAFSLKPSPEQDQARLRLSLKSGRPRDVSRRISRLG